ncbi:MAG: 30S ribosomal protein S9 [Candidatus Poribacteria bacterium]|nr:30S ribosomal protein S9 [Candidatus Poribacteria bacterium]MDE0482331.1 30S ribosomal protein S9 [Candidatus Poribacteria bacterium]
MAIEQYWGTGRRKTSVARVRIIPGGEGGILVNKKPIEEYFDRSDHVQAARRPIEHVERTGEFAVHVNVRGGGNTGQAGAISHGLARALVKADESLKPPLKKGGFLTRDPRMVERKKYGQKGARARFQFSKR